MSHLFDELKNITNEAETSLHHAESTAEIIGLVTVSLCLLCAMYQILRILSCVRWCVCLGNPYRRV